MAYRRRPVKRRRSSYRGKRRSSFKKKRSVRPLKIGYRM